MAYNKIVLSGNMARDPELRATQKGTPVCSFALAVKRRYQDVTDFHDCVAWDKQAETIHKYCRKGKEIIVDGELQRRSYEDRDGKKRWVSEIRVESFAFVGRRDDDGGQPKADAYYDDANDVFGGFAEISDDDGSLPF